MKKGILTLLILFVVSGLYAQDDYYWYNGEQYFVEDYPYKKVLEVDTVISTISELEDALNDLNLNVTSFDDLAFLEYMNHIYDSTFFDKRYAIIESDDSISEEMINNNAVQFVGPFIEPPIGDIRGVSNVFLVVLNSAEDFNMLDSLAAEYNLIIIGDSNIEPERLYYLYCTNETGMNGLEMANIFYELELFQNTELYSMFATNPLGLYGLNKSELEANVSVYPNPVNEFIYISPANNDIKIEQVDFYNMQGILLLSKTNQQQINVSGISKGVYTLLIRTNVGSIAFQIILN